MVVCLGHQRAFETCMRVFKHFRGPIIVDITLREFNYKQEARRSIKKRHAGATMRELRKRFTASNIVWPQVDPGV